MPVNVIRIRNNRQTSDEVITHKIWVCAPIAAKSMNPKEPRKTFFALGSSSNYVRTSTTSLRCNLFTCSGLMNVTKQVFFFFFPVHESSWRTLNVVFLLNEWGMEGKSKTLFPTRHEEVSGTDAFIISQPIKVSGKPKSGLKTFPLRCTLDLENRRLESDDAKSVENIRTTHAFDNTFCWLGIRLMFIFQRHAETQASWRQRGINFGIFN